MDSPTGRRRRPTLDRLPAPRLDPWLFYSHGKGNRGHTFYSLCEQKIHNRCIKEMINADVLCSAHGWLVLSDKKDERCCNLFNAATMESIELPLLPVPASHFCALSSEPYDADCIVMNITPKQAGGTCYFCRPGDVSWKVQDLELKDGIDYLDGFFDDGIRAVGCYKGQICIFTIFEKIYVLDVDAQHLTLIYLGEGMPRGQVNYTSCDFYLVESDEELLVVRKNKIGADAYDFCVCKLDINKTKALVGVENLGDRAFFLSSFDSGISSCPSQNCGITRNKIYFTDPSDPCIYSFDMQNKTVTFLLPCPDVKRNLYQADWIWPLPSPYLRCNLDSKNNNNFAPHKIQKLSRQHSLNKTSTREQLSTDGGFVRRSWSNLPDDILISIAKTLSCVDCACLATSCKAWRSVITWAPKNLQGCPSFLHFGRDALSMEVLHFVSNSRFNVHMPEDSNCTRILLAKYGWLLMGRDRTELFFFNPVTREKIEIPELPEFHVHGLCFTSMPTSSKCEIFGICEAAGGGAFIYHLARGDFEWTKVEIPEFSGIFCDLEVIPYNNPVFHNHIFYWLRSCGTLATYDPREGKVKLLDEPHKPCNMRNKSGYLLEYQEKLMSVFVCRYRNWVKVYQLNEASMTWEEIDTLGNKIVFLSKYSAVVTDANEMPELKGLEDRIYFNWFDSENRLLFYSLRAGKIQVHGAMDHNGRGHLEYQIGAWMKKPNVKLHSAQELSWLP